MKKLVIGILFGLNFQVYAAGYDWNTVCDAIGSRSEWVTSSACLPK